MRLERDDKINNPLQLEFLKTTKTKKSAFSSEVLNERVNYSTQKRRLFISKSGRNDEILCATPRRGNNSKRIPHLRRVFCPKSCEQIYFFRVSFSFSFKLISN